MSRVSTGIIGDSNFLNLKELPKEKIRKEVSTIIIPGEKLIQSFATIRDQVLFTNKRIIVGMTERISAVLQLLKRSVYMSYIKRLYLKS